jgi:hypothetical protein
VAELPELEHRVEKLEQDNARKMLVQYLIYPVILVIIGWYLNRALESQKLEVQRIQVTQTLLPSLFSDNHSQALATELIVSKVEPDLAADLHKITATYYEEKVKSDIGKGQYESADSIIAAAKSVGGPVADQILKSTTTPTTEKALNQLGLARQKERAGFQALLDGDFAKAQEDFRQSEGAYPGYHQVYEIGRLLRSRQKDFNNSTVRKQIAQTIVEQYYRGAPPDLFEQLRQSAGL